MTANRPIEVWEAALGRHVVLIEARTWFEARDVARLMLGGEPEYTAPPAPFAPDYRLRFFDKPGDWYLTDEAYCLSIRMPRGIARDCSPPPLL